MTRYSLQDDGGDIVNYYEKYQSRDGSRKYLTAPIVIGEILAVISLVIALFIAYQLYVTTIAAKNQQQSTVESLRNDWQLSTKIDDVADTHDVDTESGAVAIMHADKLGPDFYPVYTDAYDQSILAKGPAIYDDSYVIGESPNIPIAAHRDGWNSPFSEADKFAVCDEITVETQTDMFVYRVVSSSEDANTRYQENSQCLTDGVSQQLSSGNYSSTRGQSIVSPTDMSYLSPVPKSDATPSSDIQLITLTTCHPHWSNESRLLVQAVLTEVLPKVS